jgi:quercetin dioxygenase-like cupin family protein
MRSKTEWLAAPVAKSFGIFTVIVLAVAILIPFRSNAQAPAAGAQAAQPAGDPYHRITLIDNARVLVERLTLQPGQRTDPPGKTHTDPRDVVVVQLTPGDIYVNTGESNETGHQDTGKVWWISTPHQHSLANVGKDPFDLITVHLKEPAPVNVAPAAPPAAPAAPAAGAVPAVNFMKRVVKLDNARVIAYLESEDIGQRTDPPGRTHPDQMDGVVIMMTPGNIEFNTGEKIEVGHQEIGKTWWMPKPPFTHSLANYGFTRNDPGGPYTFMVVSLKNVAVPPAAGN